MLDCTNFLWWLNSDTLTQLKGQTLPGSQIFLFLKKNWFSHPILTQVRTGSLIFSQGITYDDTLRDQTGMPG
jgi:hypothetical protein